MDNRAISRKLGDEWSHLTPEEKSPYRYFAIMYIDLNKDNLLRSNSALTHQLRGYWQTFNTRKSMSIFGV